MITIIDYGVGNVFAFQNVFKRLDIPTIIAKTEDDLDGAEKLVLPGVGSFDFAMSQLNASGMRDKLDDLVLNKKIPVIGICVGMQMMATSSEEGKLDGLNWINAMVLKFDEGLIDLRTKTPHMGWNDVVPEKNHRLFVDLEQDSTFYFLHSYYVKCENQYESIALSDYGMRFSAAVQRENIYGVQFHPEKSHHYGEKLLENFANI